MPAAALDTSSSSTGILPSNISRQAIVFHSTVGLPKCQVMEKMVLAINPGCDVTTLQAFIPKDSLGEMLSQFPRPDYIVDAIDIVPQKLVLAKWCRKQRIPLLSSMGGTDKLDPSCLQVYTDQEDFRQPPCQGHAQRRPEAQHQGARGTLLDREGRGFQASEDGGWKET